MEPRGIGQRQKDRTIALDTDGMGARQRRILSSQGLPPARCGECTGFRSDRGQTVLKAVTSVAARPFPDG
jgi:hypothetical protein